MNAQIANVQNSPEELDIHKLRSTQKRFSKKVRDYLQKKFEIGQQAGRKERLAQVADDNWRAKNANGERMFTRTERLTKLLVLFFFLETFCQAKVERPKRIHPRRSD